MCGICGIVGFGDEQTVCRMRETLVHRGPDSAGAIFFKEERIGFGHRRLKVIDLSAEADQPMTQEDGSVWLIFNGEIYNFMELRMDLQARGHRFKSKSDTEVVLHLYEEYGTKCFDMLNGMFALAIFDRPRGKLFIARDHLGIKPLYYHYHETRFVFGSEIKAILASGIYSADVNWQGLYDYFTYLYVPCPNTIFAGIFQVPPAHVLELDLRIHKMHVWRYWHIEGLSNHEGAKRNSDGYGEEKKILLEQLTDTVRRQMISDVPLGIFLSGGVDSPILTGLMARVSSRPIKTFTIIFQEKDVEYYNEKDAAKTVAHHFGTEHHEISVDIEDPMEMLHLIEFFDQPFGNPTFYLMYLISKYTRQELTVALCGAGGDELFAGYPRYRAVALARRFPQALYPLLGKLRWILGIPRDDYRTMTLRRCRRFLEGLDRDFARQFVKWTYFFDEEKKRHLFNGRLRILKGLGDSFLFSDRIVRQYLEESPFDDFGNRMLHVDVQTFLLDNVLEYTDKMSMSVGLEVRVPYLDRRVVENSLKIPFDYKLRGGKSKIVLKEVFGDLLPEVNLKAPKRGFNAPLAIWMRSHLDRYFNQHMSKDEVRRQGILEWEYIQFLREQHCSGKRDNSYELFSIMMFDVWFHKYILHDESYELASD